MRYGDTIVEAGVPVRLRGLHCYELGMPGGEQARQEILRLVAGAPCH